MSSEEESVSGEEYESVEEEVDESGSEEEESEEEEEESEEEEVVVAEPVKKRGKKSKGKKKDPNKPKRNMSAFFLYSNANRQRVRDQNKGIQFGQVAKILSVEFKALGEEDKQKWEKKAAKDKARYIREMKSYVPPSDSDSDSDEPKRGKKKAKKVKDPNRPKRNQSSFFIYSNEVRADVKKENPEAKFGDIAKIISVQFKALSDKDKKRLEKLAAKDKERYQREMAEYNGN